MPQPDAKQDSENWLERVWEYREDVLYPSLFGETHKGIFTIPAEMFKDTFKQESVDPRWLFYGVLEFAPTPARTSWLYVTSGMSNDWEAAHLDPTTPSGLGCEFVFETTEQSQWAILRLLHLMAAQILLSHGGFPGRSPLGDFDRVPLHVPIFPGHPLLTRLMLAPPTGFPREAQLESGPFQFYQVVGISEAEAAHARLRGGPALLELLVANNYFPVTDPDRPEVPTGTS
jgi:Suppressor of fused protein (SUFU)